MNNDKSAPARTQASPLQRQRKRTLFLVQFSLLLAIEALFCFTPLGSIPIPGGIVMTLMMLPVVVTAVLLGPGAGSLMGFFAGLFSFIVWSFLTPPTSAMFAFAFTPVYAPGNFWSLVICFAPRILAGTAAGFLCRASRRIFRHRATAESVAAIVAGIAGSLVNTLLVLGGIYVFFGAEYAAAGGITFSALLGVLAMTVVTNGIIEAVAAAVVSGAVCIPLNMMLNNKYRNTGEN